MKLGRIFKTKYALKSISEEENLDYSWSAVSINFVTWFLYWEKEIEALNKDKQTDDALINVKFEKRPLISLQDIDYLMGYNCDALMILYSTLVIAFYNEYLVIFINWEKW